MQKKEWILVGALGVVVIGLAVLFFVVPKMSPSALKNPVDVGGGALVIEDQDTLTSVRVSVTLVAPGFVTLHESLGGAPATIIGMSDYLPVGMYPEVEIVLTKEMKPDHQYIGLLHADNGDRAFVVTDDMPVKVNEEVVRANFVSSTKEE
jgi:hypothetical protein